jgi:hypothetical protein
MNQEPETERIACVALKRRVQAEIYERIKDLSPAEQIEYFRRSAEEGPFADWLRRVRDAQHERGAGQQHGDV